MNIYEAKDYRVFLKYSLTNGKERAPRGRLTELAKVLNCHVTFLGQVTRGTSNFSLEQGFKLCEHLSFSDEETRFFLDLINYEKSGDHKLKQFYLTKLKQARQSYSKLEMNISSRRLKKEIEEEYFSNWKMQLIHSFIQIPELNTVTKISNASGFKKNEVLQQLKKLEQFQLAKYGKNNWKSTNNFLHIDKNSPAAKIFHSLWRTLSTSKIISRKKENSTPSEINFTSLLISSEETVKKIHDLLVQDIDSIAKKVDSSTPSTVYLLGVDFFQLKRADLSSFADN